MLGMRFATATANGRALRRSRQPRKRPKRRTRRWARRRGDTSSPSSSMPCEPTSRRSTRPCWIAPGRWINCTSRRVIPTGSRAVRRPISTPVRRPNARLAMRRRSLQSVEECYRGRSVRVFRLDRAGTVDRLRARAHRLLEERADVLEVRLFGSLARGDAHPGSDADLLIVVRDGAPPFLERIAGLARYFGGVGI